MTWVRHSLEEDRARFEENHTPPLENMTTRIRAGSTTERNKEKATPPGNHAFRALCQHEPHCSCPVKANPRYEISIGRKCLVRFSFDSRPITSV